MKCLRFFPRLLLHVTKNNHASDIKLFYLHIPKSADIKHYKLVAFHHQQQIYDEASLMCADEFDGKSQSAVVNRPRKLKYKSGSLDSCFASRFPTERQSISFHFQMNWRANGKSANVEEEINVYEIQFPFPKKREKSSREKKLQSNQHFWRIQIPAGLASSHNSWT